MPSESKHGFFTKLMLFFNIVSVFFLLLAYSAAYISPDGFFWWLQLIGLAYGFILVVNLFFIAYWLLLRKRLFLYSLIAVLIGAGRIFNIVEFHVSSDQPKHDSTTHAPIKVMSFNVRLFDLYNWFHNDKTRKRIFDFLKKESPDIICFQEYFHSERADLNARNNDTLRSILRTAFSQIEYDVTYYHLDHYGIAVFSKYPLINKQVVRLQTDRIAYIYSDVVAGEDTLRIVNTHLQSIHFRAEDYKFIENINKDVKQDEIEGGIRILKSMKRAYGKRAQQVDLIKDSISKSPYPVILCGDFNDTPSSYIYHRLEEGMNDAFRESGSGFGKTYAGPFPSFRIDYILYDKRLRSSDYRTHHEKLSDHYAISCTIEN